MAHTGTIKITLLSLILCAVGCSNIYTASYNPPTVPGVAKVTCTGTSKGSTLKIFASGQLYCYEGGKGQWENFSYTADGVVF